MARRSLFAIAGLAMILHGLGMSRTILPAQDGLKFIRVAKQFQTEPWDLVVRNSDQHPLYSALIALVEPSVALIWGHSPTAWRVAAQLISAVAAIATLLPLFAFARSLFGEKAALLATLVYVILPIPGAIGRDTLSDSLALFFFATALYLGDIALRTGLRSTWIGTGLVAGLGYLARPEILIIPTAVALTNIIQYLHVQWMSHLRTRKHLTDIKHADEAVCLPPLPRFQLRRLGELGFVTLVFVGGYALIKGEVSEKLSIRSGMKFGSSARTIKANRPAMPAGLDGSQWSFAAKEESTEVPLKGSVGRTSLRLAQQWAEGFGWIMLPFLIWGLIQSKTLPGSNVGRQLVAVYSLLFTAVVIRHATILGYLSGRHALTLVVATVPWVGAGIWSWIKDLPRRRHLCPILARRLGIAGLSGLVLLGVTAQVKEMHPSRWGHHAAGLWLRANAKPAESVLDTRGWAMFVRGGSGYDYWHVRQALTDASLGYVVVGTDELNAKSRRAATLRSLLAYAGQQVAEFPDREGSRGVGVRIYQFSRPDSWEGIRP